MSLLSIRQVSKSFQSGRRLDQDSFLAVNQANLEIAPGDSLGLVGESGSGKTTLGRMAVGLTAPSSGSILLEDRPLSTYKRQELAVKVQMVFQDPYSSLNPRLSIGSSVAEPLILSASGHNRRLHRNEIKAKTAETLETVGLDPSLAGRYPHEFSGGQRQRVAIARALISGARFIVCDEPVSALDASVQAQVLNMLKTQRQERGLTYLFISHDLGVVGFMCNRIAVMYCGSIVEQAPCDALLDQPAHPYTRALIDSAPVRDPAGRGKSQPLQGDLPDPAKLPQGCVFHPRCSYAREVCRIENPPLRRLDDQRSCLCHFPLC